MRSIGLVIAALSLLLPLAAWAADPVDLVDPFVGTSGDHGQLTPAATGPYGMVQLSPDTRPTQHAGYDFAATQLTGFSHTRAVGVGCGGAGGDLHVAVGYAGEGPVWPMDKASERAAPGWYSVRYGQGIAAQLAALGAAGVSQFEMPRAGTVRVVLDPRHGYTKPRTAEWTAREAGDLRGRMSAGTVCDAGLYHLAFAATLTLNDRPVSVAATPLDGDRLAFDVPVKAGDRIAVRTGLSVVDPASARRVLETLVGGRSLEQVRAAARAAWAAELARVQVPGDDERVRLLYTHLFRVMQTPARIDDADGRYRRSDGSLHQVPKGRHRYAGWAIWDNYRTQLPLIGLLDSDRSIDIAASLAELYLAGKTAWPTQTEPFITVRTEHAGVALLDFRRKGIAGFDGETILPLMVAELKDLERKTPDEQIETAYDTWAVAELARDLGQTALADRLGAEALSYRKMWREVFGQVSDDFDVVKARGLYQGTLWQYRWAPVFDLDWLVEQGLGRARFEAELDQFFDQGLFNMTNQPDIHAPFLYARIGEAGRMAAQVDQILHRPMDHGYTNGGKRPKPWVGRAFALDPVGYADGMDDDAGGMAAWYVWASLGLYPLTPGEPRYALTVPSFARSRIALPGGRAVTIERRGPATGRLAQVLWNGRPLDGLFIDHAALVRGGTLAFVVEPKA